MSWYYADGAQRVGPVDETAIKNLITAKTISATTLVWRKGMAEWKPASQSELSPMFSAAPDVDSPPPLSANETHSQTVPNTSSPRATNLYIAVIVYAAATTLDAYAFWSNEVGLRGLLSLVEVGAVVAMIIFGSIFLHRAWANLPVAEQRVSPGRAVAFMFIPLFNLYWVFTAVRELAVRTADAGRRNAQPATNVVGFATALSVLFIVYQVFLLSPILGFFGTIAFLIVLSLWAAQQERASALATGSAHVTNKGLLIGACASTAACLVIALGMAAYSSSKSQGSYQQNAGFRPPPANFHVQEHQTCLTCKGSGLSTFPCSSCNGTGISNGRMCSFCKGKLFSQCYACSGRGWVY